MEVMQGIRGPVVGGGYSTQQVGGVATYVPYQTDTWSEMFGMMMPMIMMIMMMAVLMPMFKGITKETA